MRGSRVEVMRGEAKEVNLSERRGKGRAKGPIPRRRTRQEGAMLSVLKGKAGEHFQVGAS